QGKTRRQFSASEKLRLVKAAETALASGERGALEALLRQEGIYSSQLLASDPSDVNNDRIERAA
ncbi:MAG TPA: hypothetical protein VFT22_06930, partial [Kofleriaceae bacterium]|nr:hypothetical protein [Kofleriaceae bacterium]